MWVFQWKKKQRKNIYKSAVHLLEIHAMLCPYLPVSRIQLIHFKELIYCLQKNMNTCNCNLMLERDRKHKRKQGGWREQKQWMELNYFNFGTFKTDYFIVKYRFLFNSLVTVFAHVLFHSTITITTIMKTYWKNIRVVIAHL